MPNSNFGGSSSGFDEEGLGTDEPIGEIPKNDVDYDGCWRLFFFLKYNFWSHLRQLVAITSSRQFFLFFFCLQSVNLRFIATMYKVKKRMTLCVCCLRQFEPCVENHLNHGSAPDWV